MARVRPDLRIVIVDDFEGLKDRLEGALKGMREIAKIAGKKGWWALGRDEILIAFRLVFSTLQSGNVPLGLAAPRGSMIAVEPAGDPPRRSGSVRNAWIMKGTDRGPAPASLVWGPRACGTGSRKIEILSAFCEFSRLCRPENFASVVTPIPR